MSARNKLNVADINGAVFFGGIAGLVFDSFPIFLLTSAALIAMVFHDGGIRTRPRR
jgi:hypothetical protein